MTKRQTGSDKDQQSLNLDLGSAAFCDRNAMPETTFGYPKIEKYRLDTADNYRVRVHGDEYYGSGLKLSRSGAHGYTGTLMFEKVKTDSDDQVVDAKTGDRIIQLYSSVSNNEGAYCSSSSIVAELIEDAADQTSVAGRIHFQPDGGNVDVVSIDADGIKFNGDTATVNALNDYEEGTFTPTFGGTTTDPTVTYATQSGHYTKIGNLVNCFIQLRTSAASGGSGVLLIEGLPFSVTGNSDECGGSVGLVINLSNSTGTEMVQADSTLTSLIVLKNTTNSGHLATDLTSNTYFRCAIQYLTTA